MAIKRFVFVANDKSPSEAFKALSMTLRSTEGADTASYLGDGKLETPSEEIVQAVTYGGRQHTMILIGMSSKPDAARLEILAARTAMENGIPFGLFSDSFFCYRREHFAEFREKCSVLFVASEAEIPEAQAMFPNARIVATGHPNSEGFENPNLTIEAIREAIGATAGDRVILVPLNKVREPSLDLAQKCIEWCSAYDVARTLVVIAPHPGAVKQNPEEPDYYAGELRKWLNEIAFGYLRRHVVLREKDMGVRAQDVLRVAAFVLSSQSPTTDLQAAQRRVPLFNYLRHPGTEERLKKEIGATTAPLCDLGAALEVFKKEQVFDWGNHMKVIAGQKAAFPNGAPAPGTAVGLMLRGLFL